MHDELSPSHSLHQTYHVVIDSGIYGWYSQFLQAGDGLS